MIDSAIVTKNGAEGKPATLGAPSDSGIGACLSPLSSWERGRG